MERVKTGKMIFLPVEIVGIFKKIKKTVEIMTLTALKNLI